MALQQNHNSSLPPDGVLFMCPILYRPIAKGTLYWYYNDMVVVNVWGKRFKLPQLTHESFLTIDHSCKIFFWYLPNWTSTNLWCVVLYATYSTTHQRSVEVQFGRYQKNILQEWCRVKKLSCVSCGSLKRFPHTFTNIRRTNQDIRSEVSTELKYIQHENITQWGQNRDLSRED